MSRPLSITKTHYRLKIISHVNSYLVTHKAFIIYMFSGFISKGVGLLMLPFFTTHLSPHDYGQINILSNFILIATPFIYLSVLQTISSDFFKFPEAVFKKLLSSLIYLPVICTAAILLISIPFSSSISSYFQVFTVFLFLAPVFVLGNFYTELVLVLLRNYNRPWKYFWYIMLKVILEVSVSLILILFVYNNLWGRIWGIAIGSLFSLPIAVFFFRKKITGFTWDFKAIKSEFLFSVPIIINQFSIAIFTTSDKFFLARYVSVAELGAYSVAFQLSYVIVIISNSYYTFVAPKIFDALTKKSIPLIMEAVKSYKIFVAANVLICLFTFFLSGFVYEWLIGKSFIFGQRYLPYILGGLFFWSITNPLFSVFYYYKAKRLITVLSVGALIVNISLNYFFSSAMGGIGIALSSSVFYCVLFVSVILLIQSVLSKQLSA